MRGIHSFFIRHRAGLLLLALLPCLAAAPSMPTVEQAKTAGRDAAPLRQREGTSLTDVTGFFKLTGDRATFYAADESVRFGALENLMLERVTQAVRDNPDQLQWLVSGTITEYRGTNYLLITRAVLKTKPTAASTSTKRAAPRKANDRTAPGAKS